MFLSRLRILAKKPPVQRVLKVGKTLFSPRYLLYTNVIISGQLGALGDVIQQSYQHSKPGNTDKWDPIRTAKMFGAGICLSPFVHFWYLNLDRFLPGNTVKIAFIKLFPDLLLFSPSYVVLFLTTISIFDGQDWKTYKKDLKGKFLGLFSVEVFLWTPAQFINFKFLPTRFRVIYDNTISLMSDVLYSYFRFEVDDDDEAEESDKKVDIL